MDKQELEKLKKRLDDIKKIKPATIDEAAYLFAEVNGIHQKLKAEQRTY